MLGLQSRSALFNCNEDRAGHTKTFRVIVRNPLGSSNVCCTPPDCWDANRKIEPETPALIEVARAATNESLVFANLMLHSTHKSLPQ
jgi:hypothetical protein